MTDDATDDDATADNATADDATADAEAEDAGFALTDEQADALVLDRNVALTAGAGTGKTTTLTRRYLELLRSDPEVMPTDIGTITFTRKAAAELETRVREAVYAELATAESPAERARWRTVLDEIDEGYTHTVHAFCARLLREHAMQAPVPMAFDVLDETDAADLQREVAVDFVDANADDPDVALLSRLFGSHGRLVDVLGGLLAERPDSESWCDAWRDGDPDDYVDYLWERVCDLDGDTATEFFDAAPVRDALATARRFRDESFDTADGADGVAVLREVAAITDDLSAASGPRPFQRACRELYDRLETNSGGLYASASHHLIGTKATWNDETDAYADCKSALTALLDHLSEIEDEIRTTPGERERNSAHYVLALARVFDRVLDAYETEKLDRDALDFPDVIETTIDFLRADPEARAALRESFAALMVDEFQDTDGRQWELIALLADLADDGVETDNVFLVGDKKQSIYGFRGADVTTFDAAKSALRRENERLDRDSIPDGEGSPTEMELSGNFRTLETPLAFLNELFEAVFDPEGETAADYEAEPQPLSFERGRIEDTDALRGSVDYLAVPEAEASAAALLGADHPVTDAAAEHTVAAEAEALGDRLSTLLADPPRVYDADEEAPREAVPEDVAILLRRRTHLDRYQRALDDRDVPYTVVSGVGFYGTPEVRTLTNLLRVLADPDDAVSLYGVLRSPLFGFTDDRLAPLAASDDPLWEALRTTSDGGLADAFDLLRRWRELSGCVQGEATVLPWNRVLTRVFDDTGYLVSVGADEGGRQAVANVEKFRDEIREWSEAGTRTAASLLRRIDRQAELDPREGEAEVPEGTDGVRIMTIHAAKGLEFPIVAVPDLGSDLNFGRSVDGYGHVRLVTAHDDAPFLAASGPSSTDAFDVGKTTAHAYADEVELPRERAEAKRLLYVACTRTRDHLLLCGTHAFDTSGETVALDAVNDPTEASAWRDFLQPALLEREGLVSELAERGSVRTRIGDAAYTVRLPGTGESWNPPTTESAEEYPRIEIPDRPEREGRRRVTATQLVEAGADRTAARSGRSESEPDGGSGETALPRNEFGTIVHRVLELDAERAEWPELVERIAGVNGFDVPDGAMAELIGHIADARAFLDRHDDGSETETHEELSIDVDVGSVRIVGDIDHLRVTPEAFVITDYKTNRVGARTTADLAEHYRPQMMSYALALLESAPERDVEVNLRFTDVGTTESFRWTAADRSTLADELAALAGRVAETQTR
mgnify:CR=1 FL=1